jgi:hypothetical protein
LIITIITIFGALVWLMVETKWLTIRLPIYALEPVIKIPDMRMALRMIDTHGILALAGIIGPFILVVLDITASLTAPDYSPIRQSMSALALTSVGWVETIGFMLMGLMIEAFTAGLYLNIKRRRGFGFGTALLTFFGFGMLVVGTFKTNESGAPSTFNGIVHTIAADSVLGLFPIALALILPSIKNDPQWNKMFIYTIITAVIALLLAVCQPFFPDDFQFFGLYERILVLNALLWLGIFAGRLLVVSCQRCKTRIYNSFLVKNLAGIGR